MLLLQEQEIKILKSQLLSKDKELAGLRSAFNGNDGRLEELEEALRQSALQIDFAREGLLKADSHISEQGRKERTILQERDLATQFLRDAQKAGKSLVAEIYEIKREHDDLYQQV